MFQILVKFFLADRQPQEEKREVADCLRIPREGLPAGCVGVELLLEEFCASVGEGGYFVLPSVESNGNAAQVFFTERADAEERYQFHSLPVFAVVRGGRGLLAIVTGMRFEYELVVEKRGSRYRMYPHFAVDPEWRQSDLEVHFVRLGGADANWCGAARAYRRFQLSRGVCRPLAERMVEQPVLREALMGPEVRVRLAWKPVPSPVPEQTEENEPPLHVAITFAQCEEIVEEFHRQGIRHAEFCLVGWNKSGHDGRYPDLFPVEPALGGEEALRHLIEKARSYGYLIVGHTNVTDSYTIAKRWKREFCLIDKDGSLHQCGNWGGGNSYHLCPKRAYEEYAQKDMEDLKALGFHGLHYLDVLSILPPSRCYSQEHPLTFEESALWRGKALALAQKAMGGSASEGAWDFCIGEMDYSLYTIFHRFGEKKYLFADHFIPFFHVVYHGILLYNTCCDTVNSAIKSDPSLTLLNFLYGGRPLAYFHAKFLEKGVNWMGNDDLVFHSREQLAPQVARIKKEYDAYQELAPRQTDFLEEFQELVPGKLFRVAYFSGKELFFNLSEEPLELQGHTYAPLHWELS